MFRASPNANKASISSGFSMTASDNFVSETKRFECFMLSFGFLKAMFRFSGNRNNKNEYVQISRKLHQNEFLYF